MTTSEIDGPDIVVAGAGGGLVAALRAAEAGLSVLVIESNESFRRGNNTSMSTAMIPAMGTRFQSELGITDSCETFLSDVAAKTKGDFNVVAAHALAEASADLVEWLADSVGLDMSLVTDFAYPGHSVSRCHTIPGHSGVAMLDGILTAVKDNDLIDLYVPARLVDIRIENDIVMGVIVETPSGREEIPTRAVVIATNGYGADRELLDSNIPEIAEAIYYGSEHSRGDAVRIGHSLGIAVDYLDAYQGHAGLAMPAASLATWATVMHGGFLVNSDGRRYGDETQGYSEYAAESIRHAEDGSWIIIDRRIYDACLEFADFQNVVESNGVRWGDTAEELAEMIGISILGLSASFEAATSAASGSPDEFGRVNWEAALTGPLAAIHVRPALFHTQGGLRIDAKARPLRQDGSQVAGLYAAGGAAAGISGHGARGYLAGNGLLPALGLSYIAAADIESYLR